MRIQINPQRLVAKASPLLYGHFLEHFHRQVYGGVFDPQSPFANEHGFRSDVIEALRNIRTPIIRWPGGCFVSSYNWKKGVGENRTPVFDKAWRVEELNTFGTDEFVQLCRDIGCEPYICTNAGTGTAEEMSDWVEYCNLPCEGEFARWRIRNGFEKPHNVKYWSVGNDDNSLYTMADAVFSGSFLNMVLRHADIVGMANFAPVINTRGAIYTYPGGIVKRTTYHVFDMYVHLMGDEVIDQWVQDVPLYRVCGEQGEVDVDCIDAVSTRRSHDGAVAIALVNKHISDAQQVEIPLQHTSRLTLHTLCGSGPDDYNDVGRENVTPFINNGAVEQQGDTVRITLPAHSVNILVAE